MASQQKMKAIVYRQASNAAALRISEWKKPSPKKNEVLVKVAAFGVNFADISGRKGEYPSAPPFPFIAGYEVAGVVEQIGADVENVAVGDRVLAFTDFGGYAEYAVARSPGVSKIPDSMDFASAAVIPVQFVTAYHCIYQTGPIHNPNMRILIHACAGGVGQAAVQFAKHLGFTVFGTCSSQKKVDLLKELGVDHPINYVANDYAQEVKKICPQGVDIVLNSLGGSTVKKDVSVLRPGGRVVGFGAASLSSNGFLSKLSIVPSALSMMSLNGLSMLFGSVGYYGVNMKSIGDERPDLLAYELKEILKMFEEGTLKSTLSGTYDWREIGKVQTLMETRKTTGKIVMTIPQREEKQ